MPMLRNKTKIMTHTVFFRVMIPKWTKIPVISILKMPHFQTAITRQLYGDNVFSKVLLERATLLEYDSVYFI